MMIAERESIYHWLRAYAEKIFSSVENDFSIQKVLFLSAFSVVGILSLLTFGVVNVLEGNAVFGWAEIFFGFIGLVNNLLVFKTRNIIVASRIPVACIFIVLLLVVYAGGVERTGILWFAVFAPLTLFLLGRREGLLWVASLFLAVLIIMALQVFGGILTAYTFIELRQLAFSFFASSIMIYFYQRILDDMRYMTEEQQHELKKQNFVLLGEIRKREVVELGLARAKDDLEGKVTERTQELILAKSNLEQTVAERTRELQKKVEELEVVNKAMIGRELRMAELKRENEQLKGRNVRG